MSESFIPKVNIEEIKQDLRREVNEKKWVSEEVQGPRMDLPSFTPITIEVPSFKKYVDRLLWKYGIRYANIIKAIPILNRKAEKVHSRLSRKKTLEEFIFNLQENINAALYQQFNRQHAAFLRFQGEWKAQQRNEKESVNLKIERFAADLSNFRQSAGSQIDEKFGVLKGMIDSENKVLRELLERKWKEDLLEFLEAEKRAMAGTLADLREEFETRDKQVSDQVEAWVKKIERRSPDSIDVALLEIFRGKREDTKEKQRIYLPYIETSKAGTPQAPILDLGCGRGEWLELLKEHGYIAEGVDQIKILIERCRESGLAVVESDLMDYLKSQPPNKFGAVTGFHILEHLPWPLLAELFRETVRVLQPRGIAIFETPNPENILVGCSQFYLDPTHYAPLPSPLLEFLSERSGLTQIEIRYLHPFPETMKVSPSELGERFNQYFYGPQDYAVIGVKP
jgi:O-antigen chain-terminating methyltransferase